MKPSLPTQSIMSRMQTPTLTPVKTAGERRWIYQPLFHYLMPSRSNRSSGHTEWPTKLGAAPRAKELESSA
eukprot:5519094-Lingulodinium_polyedra.AAC.1